MRIAKTVKGQIKRDIARLNSRGQPKDTLHFPALCPAPAIQRPLLQKKIPSNIRIPNKILTAPPQIALAA